MLPSYIESCYKKSGKYFHTCHVLCMYSRADTVLIHLCELTCVSYTFFVKSQHS